MKHFICTTCGTQYAASPAPPEHCRICEDDRQYVGEGGQRWTTLEELAAAHRVVVTDDAGVTALRIEPHFAIGQRAAVIPAAGGNILWETLSLVTPEAVAAITRNGPISWIAISHPHFYASMVEWSDALGGAPILLHEADRQWVSRPSPNIVFWSGDDYRLTADATLIRCGGHFDGSTALHWRGGPRPGGALFAGDSLQVAADHRHVSFMYSYPNFIPMHPDAVRLIRSRVEPYQFEDVFGYSHGRNIVSGARDAVTRSFDRYLSAVGA
jgi:hypothetical protein